MSHKIIDGKYYKIKTLGSGGQGKVYLVEDKDHNEFISKIIEKKEFKYEKEYLEDKEITNRKIKLFEKINSISSPYLTLFKEAKTGQITENDIVLFKRTYYIFEYCKYGDLCLFVGIAGGFEKKINKLIFKKIVYGVKALHEAGIFHRDLKLDNIVIDEFFNPKICDFDMCTDETGKLKDRCGTKSYMPPQKFEDKEYKGDKADIFSLGCLLFSLIARHKGFSSANKNDKVYNLVIENKKDTFFKTLNIESFDEDFKSLYYKMIAYNEEDRPTLDQILNSKWLNEINSLKDEMKHQLEDEAKTAIINKKNYIDRVLKNNPFCLEEYGYVTSSINKLVNKGIGENKKKYIKEYFKQSSQLDYIDIDLEGEIYIEIIGGFDYYDFMNCFVNEINKEEKYKILDYKNDYKCNIQYKENEKGGDNSDNIIIKMKLYTTGEKEYLIRFLRKAGGLLEYYEKVRYISSLGEKLLKEKYM